MKTVNCVNCGAPIDLYAAKCPYCGTSYFDMTHIDVSSYKPVGLHLILPNQRQMLTTLAIPTGFDMRYCPDMLYGDNLIVSSSYCLDIDLSFKSVPKPENQHLFSIIDL